MDKWTSWCFGRNGRQYCSKQEVWSLHSWQSQETKSEFVYRRALRFYQVKEGYYHAFGTRYSNRSKITNFNFWILRRKYEKLEFFNFDEQALLCPYPAPHRRSSSSSTSSSSHDKKHYEKQATRHRIGIAFRNSWGRKESESKNSKKANSLVIILCLIYVNSIGSMNNFWVSVFSWEWLSE